MNFGEKVQELAKDKREQKIKNLHKNSFEDWKRIGYSDEQAKELERLSRIGNDMGDIDTHVADKILQETMKREELEKYIG